MGSFEKIEHDRRTVSFITFVLEHEKTESLSKRNKSSEEAIIDSERQSKKITRSQSNMNQTNVC